VGRESAKELRAVAPLVVTGGETPVLVGPCTLVTNGKKLIAFSSAEMLRAAPEPLAIALTLDGTKLVPVATWNMTRCPQLGIMDLGEVSKIFPRGEASTLDVEPVSIAGVSATVDTRGAPSALITIEAAEGAPGFVRRLVPIHVDLYDGGGMSDDVLMRLASPDEAFDIDAPVDGAALVSWMPADPVLGRKSEVVVVALGCAYNDRSFKPRELPPIAALYGLEDLGRALPPLAGGGDHSNELGQVAGEIKES
jgi:hypothetical protein